MRENGTVPWNLTLDKQTVVRNASLFNSIVHWVLHTVSRVLILDACDENSGRNALAIALPLDFTGKIILVEISDRSRPVNDNHTKVCLYANCS